MRLASRAAPFRTNKSPYWVKYWYDGEGYNYRLPHLLGAVARAQIERFDKEILAEKVRVGNSFRKIFSENDDWRLQKISDRSTPVFWLNALLFKKINSEQVRKIGQYLINNQIEVRSGFWPLSDMSSFNSELVGNQKNGYHLFDNLLVLPSSWRLTDNDLLYIKQTINKCIQENF